MSDDKTGKVIGNYILQRMLGKGQYGVVYLAKHKDNGSLFAIKCISKSVVCADPRSLIRIRS